MKQRIFKIGALSFITLLLASGCNKKLDLVPTNDITSETVYSTAAGYKQAMAKVYGAMALTGNTGGSGSGDIPGEIIPDEGASDFLRQLWNFQCVTTDEAVWTYTDRYDPVGLHQFNWSSAHVSVGGLYYRSFFQITLANDFIRQSSDENLSKRNIAGTEADNIRRFRAEARFLRALQYWVLMDLYGNPPFVTENDGIGVGLPKQIQRKDLFSYIESELKAIETLLPAPRTNEYGRADQGAVWALLSRMYLNAEVYTGTARFTDAITYCNKVITSGYSLHNNYKELMLADNNLIRNEFIFTIAYDGTKTQNWGGTTMLAHGPSTPDGDAAIAKQYVDSTGVTSWGCIRITPQFVDLFNSNDIRGQFWRAGHTKEMPLLTGGTARASGYSSTKFRNKTRTGAPAPNRYLPSPTENWVDIDFPLFRLAEVYLTYAEAVLRGGQGGNTATALSYLQQLAVRARPSDPAAAASAQMTLNYILEERGREMMWECVRRTDLIRYGHYTSGTFLWAWKGGVQGGTGVSSRFNLLPIPSTDLSANPNLVQNPGY